MTTAAPDDTETQPPVRVKIGLEGEAMVTIGNNKAYVSVTGDVTAITDTGVSVLPVTSATASGPSDVKKIAFDEKAVSINGATLQLAEGEFLIATSGKINVQQTPHETALAVAAAAPVAVERPPIKVGDKGPDGWVYAGKVHGKPLFAAPEDFVGTVKEAKKAIAELESQGIFARIPSKGELRALFKRQAAIGGFKNKWESNDPKSTPPWYFSSRSYCFIFLDSSTGTDFSARSGEFFNTQKKLRYNTRLVHS